MRIIIFVAFVGFVTAFETLPALLFTHYEGQNSLNPLQKNISLALYQTNQVYQHALIAQNYINSGNIPAKIHFQIYQLLSEGIENVRMAQEFYQGYLQSPYSYFFVGVASNKIQQARQYFQKILSLLNAQSNVPESIVQQIQKAVQAAEVAYQASQASNYQPQSNAGFDYPSIIYPSTEEGSKTFNKFEYKRRINSDSQYISSRLQEAKKAVETAQQVVEEDSALKPYLFEQLNKSLEYIQQSIQIVEQNYNVKLIQITLQQGIQVLNKANKFAQKENQKLIIEQVSIAKELLQDIYNNIQSEKYTLYPYYSVDNGEFNYRAQSPYYQGYQKQHSYYNPSYPYYSINYERQSSANYPQSRSFDPIYGAVRQPSTYGYYSQGVYPFAGYQSQNYDDYSFYGQYLDLLLISLILIVGIFIIVNFSKIAIFKSKRFFNEKCNYVDL